MVRNKDKKFLEKVGEAIVKQQEYNEDDFNLVITKAQIKASTNRTVVRGVILEEYAEALGGMVGVEASVKGNKLILKAKSEQNQIFQENYNTVDDLISSNNKIESEE